VGAGQVDPSEDRAKRPGGGYLRQTSNKRGLFKVETNHEGRKRGRMIPQRKEEGGTRTIKGGRTLKKE